MAERRERKQLKVELAQLEAQMAEFLKELGYEQVYKVKVVG